MVETWFVVGFLMYAPGVWPFDKSNLADGSLHASTKAYATEEQCRSDGGANFNLSGTGEAKLGIFCVRGWVVTKEK
jgi:hypothetical protein